MTFRAIELLAAALTSVAFRAVLDPAVPSRNCASLPEPKGQGDTHSRSPRAWRRRSARSDMLVPLSGRRAEPACQEGVGRLTPRWPIGVPCASYLRLHERTMVGDEEKPWRTLAARVQPGPATGLAWIATLASQVQWGRGRVPPPREGHDGGTGGAVRTRSRPGGRRPEEGTGPCAPGTPAGTRCEHQMSGRID